MACDAPIKSHLSGLFDKAVFLMLFAYFVTKLAFSVARLMEDAVGTTLEHRVDRELVFPAVTVCSGKGTRVHANSSVSDTGGSDFFVELKYKRLEGKT